jgi:hypothetical protein
MAPLLLPPKNFTVRHVVNVHCMNASLLLVCWSHFLSDSYTWQPSTAIPSSFFGDLLNWLNNMVNESTGSYKLQL